MKLNEILALAKLGYSYEQVKELMSIETPTAETKTEETIETPVEIVDTVENENPITPVEDEKTKQIEELQKQLEETNRTLKEVQDTAKTVDLSPNIPKNDDIIADIVRSFM